VFAAGAPLDQVAADIAARWRFAQRHGVDEVAGAVTRLLEEAVSRLRGVPSESPAPTSGETATRQRILRGECRYYTVVGLSPLLAPAHVLGDNGDVAELSDVIGQIVTRSSSTFLTAETAFWHAFSLVQQYETADADQRASLRSELAEFQDKLDDLAARGPGLLRARALLLSAERARLAGATEQARTRYDRAIAAARESDFIRSEAFAAERGGRHALARGDVGDAVAYLRRARACYEQWGAVAKLDQLDELLATASRPTGPTRALDQLDLLTVVQAFQSVSGELQLDRLVGVLLELLVQHSQAERGYLLLADGASLHPAAEAEVERDIIRISTGAGTAWRDRLPIDLIEYAGRCRKVLAGGPDELAALVADPYLAAHRPRSVLCAPIVRRDGLLAVLYLEHRRLAAAFSTFYLDLLDILCTQAAIALENASVHARLVEANRILDATFDRMPVGLVLLGPDLTVRRASPRAVEIMGLPIAPGTPLVELFDVLTPADVASDAYRYEPGFAAMSDGVEPIDREIVIVTPQGGRVRLSTSAIPLRDETGSLVGVTVLISRTP
jgi:PAS domain-containing protein